MSTTTTYTGVRIVDMPDLGAVTDDSSFVAEHAGSGRMAATALTSYHASRLAPIATGSTTPRTLPDRFADILNVKDFGAKGDGATDDTAAIRAAINSLATRPGTLMFSSGTYLCAPSTFTAVNNSEIRGVGRYGAVIKFTAGGTGWTFSNCQMTFLQHLAFYGTGVAGISGVCFNNGSCNNTAEDCYFANFDTDGLQVFGSSTNQLSGHRVSHCYFLQCMQKQLHFFYSNDFWIEGNQYGVNDTSLHPAYGCYIDHSSAGTYTQNYHWNNTVGLYCTDGNYLRIENNRFEESQRYGAAIGVGVHIIFSGNTVHTNCLEATGVFNQVSCNNVQGLIFDSNQAFDWGGTSRAGATFGFGVGNTELTLRANQASSFVSAPYFLDPSLAQISIAADSSLAYASRTTIGTGGGDYIGPPGAAAGAGAAGVEVPVGRATCAVSIAAQSLGAPGAGQNFGYTLVVNGTNSGLVTHTYDALFSSASANAAVLLSPTDAVCVLVSTSAGAAVTTHRVVVMLADY